jgi:hypothetical protein
LRRSRAVTAILIILAIAAGAWFWVNRSSQASSRTGAVVLEWRGSHSGRTRLPGTIAWCPITRVATFEAISNDTGLMISILENDSLSRGPHQVVTAENRDASPRPSAVAAMRWVSDTTLIGFRSMSGVVDLQPGDGTASGAFEMRFRAPVGMDTLVVRGDFRDVEVTIGAIGCG